MKQHGSIKTNEDGILEFKEFLEIYNIVESMGKHQLREARAASEKERSDTFTKAFLNTTPDQVKAKRMSYVDSLLQNMDHESDSYQQIQDIALALVNVNQHIWEHSMESCMPAGELFIKRSTLFQLSSPFAYKGNK